MNCLLIGLGNAGFQYDINSKLNTQHSHFTSIINNKKFKNEKKNIEQYQELYLYKEILV